MCPWQVAAMPCCLSSLLMMLMPVLCSSVGGWLPCFAVFQACWWCLPSALQGVSGCHALLCFKPADNACPLLSRMWVAAMPCCVSSLLADDSCPLHSREWVAAMPCCVSSLLMMPVICSPACEWLPCLAMFQACWWCLSSVLQEVSGCHALLCFKPADCYIMVGTFTQCGLSHFHQDTEFKGSGSEY